MSGKVVIMVRKQNFMKAADSFQICAEQNAGAEAAISAVHDIFKDHITENIFLIEVEKAFNAKKGNLSYIGNLGNRKPKLHNFIHLSNYIYVHK